MAGRESGSKMRKTTLGGEAAGGGAITISVGVAICPEHGNKPEILISAADTALYKAKEAGRNQVVLSAKTAEKPTQKPKIQVLRKA